MLAAPPAREMPPVAIGFVALLVALGVRLPLRGVSKLAVLLTERFVLRGVPGLRRWLGLRPQRVAARAGE